jgi:hypothetical protein
LVFSILGGLTFYYKSEIFSYFAKEYLKSQALATRNGGLDVDQDTQEMISLGTILGKAESPVLNQEGMVVDVVKKTNPAVVSIVITKEVPKYETYVDPNQQNNPFGDFFPGFNFSIPQYRQNGTEKKEIGGGSGFFVTSDGLIVTNKYVLMERNKSSKYSQIQRVMVKQMKLSTLFQIVVRHASKLARRLLLDNCLPMDLLMLMRSSNMEVKKWLLNTLFEKLIKFTNYKVRRFHENILNLLFVKCSHVFSIPVAIFCPSKV